MTAGKRNLEFLFCSRRKSAAFAAFCGPETQEPCKPLILWQIDVPKNQEDKNCAEGHLGNWLRDVGAEKR